MRSGEIRQEPNGDIDFEEYCAIMRVRLPYFKSQEIGAKTV